MFRVADRVLLLLLFRCLPYAFRTMCSCIVAFCVMIYDFVVSVIVFGLLRLLSLLLLLLLLLCAFACFAFVFAFAFDFDFAFVLRLPLVLLLRLRLLLLL